MKNHLHAFKAILPGLAVTQIIAVIQVLISNRELYRTLQIVLESGFLVVPNQHVFPSLLEFKPALLGGLFFTLTIGAGLSVSAFIAAWLWIRAFNKRKIIVAFLLLPWFAMLAAVNSAGFNPISSLYFLLVPPAVFFTTLVILPPAGKNTFRLNPLAATAIAILVIAWLPLLNSDIFFDVRDSLLLGNPVGQKLNDAYYDYTLYAAQVIKPVQQKTIKTVQFEPDDPTRQQLLARRFLDFDYLPVPAINKADITIRLDGNTLFFLDQEREIITAQLQNFLQNPTTALQLFSVRTDRQAFLRLLITASLLTASPFCLCIFLHALFFLTCRLLLLPDRASTMATILLCLLGISLSWPLYAGKDAAALPDAVPATPLAFNSWQNEARTLRLVADSRRSPDKFIDFDTAMTSPAIPVRYWFARSLRYSQDSRTRDFLRAMLDDPSINVRCMAYLGLGEIGRPEMIGPTIVRLKNEKNWYVQWYAYRALRRLGWRQQPNS